MKMFLQDPDTIASHYPFSLYSSALPSVATLGTLVVFGAQPLRIQPGFLICTVALLADGHTFRSDKRVYEKRMLGVGVP
jgi:hypothetical protein